MAQLHPQDRPLKTLHAVVESAQHVMILSVLSPVAQHANRPRIVSIVGGDRAPLAIGSEILAGIKTEARHIADAADSAALIFRAVRLGGVFDHDQSVAARDLHDRVHVGRLSVEMY